MIDEADPKAGLTPQAVSPTPVPAAPRCALLVMCTECGRGTEAPLPLDHDALSRFLAQIGWYPVVLTPPGEVPIVLSALCGSCASTIFSSEVMTVAEERRQQLLQQERRPR